MTAKTVYQLIDHVIGVEGEYVNHNSDLGGATRWGITEAVARAYGFVGDMRGLPRTQAVEIYRKRYWDEPGLARVALHAPQLAAEMFDIGVNMGTSIPGRFLQRALNVFNRRQRDYADIVVDGRIGTLTIGALQALIARRGKLAETVLLRAVDAQQGARYIEISEARPANEDFTFGWFANRVGVA